MTDVLDPPVISPHDDHGHEEHHGPTGILKWLTTTDHKIIGLSYTVTSVILFVIGGLFAEIIRFQLTAPNNNLVSLAQYNELFTMHGSVMIYLFAGPFAFGGLANIIVPIQIGAPDMAFPRLNALSYWLYLTGAITMLLGFFTAGGAANFGWVGYAPLSNSINTPGAGADLWIGGLLLTGFSAIFTGVNLSPRRFSICAHRA
jgi:cytochrome c oxidase subunit 1